MHAANISVNRAKCGMVADLQIIGQLANQMHVCRWGTPNDVIWLHICHFSAWVCSRLLNHYSYAFNNFASWCVFALCIFVWCTFSYLRGYFVVDRCLFVRYLFSLAYSPGTITSLLCLYVHVHVVLCVCITGRGNAAFEVADSIYGNTNVIHMMARSRVRLAWSTHYVGDLRCVVWRKTLWCAAQIVCDLSLC